MASRVGPSFHISETTPPQDSPEELDKVIGLVQRGIEDVKQYREQVAKRLPPDEQAAFHRRMDTHLQLLEGDLEKLTALRDSYHAIGYRIGDLTPQFKEHYTAHLADVETFKTDLSQVHKSDQAFSATFQKTTFSFPTSSNTYPATSPMGFMIASPAERKIGAAEQRWRGRVQKLPPKGARRVPRHNRRNEG